LCTFDAVVTKGVIHLAKPVSVSTQFHANQAIRLPKPESVYNTDETVFRLVLGGKTNMVASKNVMLLR
jgi:hypothetical protein